MSRLTEQPFDEREERYFLAEILKDSPINPLVLFKSIEEGAISPRWTEIALPQGRSVSACMKAFDLLRARFTSSHLASYRPASNFEQGSPSTKLKKRPASFVSGDPSIPVNPALQPRGSAFATINDLSVSPGAPAGTGEPPRKKRGRPSKEEHQRRAAEAAERGEPYPPPRKTKTPRQSADGTAPTAIMFTPVATRPGGMGESFVEQKQARNSYGEGPGKFSLEATASAAEQMQAEVEGNKKPTIPETQSAGLPGPSKLVAELREHAALNKPNEDLEMTEPNAANILERSGTL